MLGAIIGDIVGSLYEGRREVSRHIPLFAPRSRFTDDTVLSLAVAHALRTGTPYDVALRKWAREYPMAGYGASFSRWAVQDEAGPYNSYGNGSAMRVAAVAWAFDDLEQAIAEAERSAAVTHNHPEGIRGACAVVAAINAARNGASQDVISTLMRERFSYECRIPWSELEERGGFDATCQGTVPVAIAAFLHSKDFEGALRNAVSLGGDTDTLGCIAGALAEAHYGEIPVPIQRAALRRLDEPLREELRLFAERHQLVHLAGSFPMLQPKSVQGVASGVLVESISVIVRVDAIHRRFPGGWRAFRRLVPNQTLCADMELARVGFMGDAEAQAFIKQLVQHRLVFRWEGQSIDIAVIDVVRGPLVPCDWLELQELKLTPTGSRVTGACLKGGRIKQLAVPAGWKFRDSLSQQLYYQPPVKDGADKPIMYCINGGPE